MFFFGSRSEEPRLALTLLVHPSPFSSYHCIERSGTQVFKEVLDPPTFPFFATQYIDNRYILLPEEKVQNPSIQVLFCEDFCYHPVELEQVTSNELLCFLVVSKIRTVTYKLHSLDHLVSPTGWTKSSRRVRHSTSVFNFSGKSWHPTEFFSFYRRLCLATPPLELEQVISNELLGFCWF